MSTIEPTGPSAWDRAADLSVAAALTLVPLAFHSGVREFVVFKLLILSACVGICLITSAMSRAGTSRRGLVLLLPVLHVLGVLVYEPSLDAVNQAMAVATPALLAFVLVSRASHWPSRRLMPVVGVPLALNLGWSLLQALEIGVLPATQVAFGTTHGVAVGTVGNPNENCWYLVLATTLLLGLWPKTRRRWVVVLLAGVLAVVLVDRSRAVLLAALAGAATWHLLRGRGGWRRPLPIALGVGLVGVLGFAWGGVDALAGRGYLASIELDMLLSRGGLPAGLGAFAADFPSAQAVHLAAHPEQAHLFSRLDHAHNDLLELVYELGAPSLLWVAAIGVAIWRAKRWDHPMGMAATACLVEGAVLSAFGYPLFSPAVAVVWALALALALDDGAAPGRRIPTTARVAMVLVGAGLLVAGARRYQAEREVTRCLQAAYDGKAEAARRHAARAEQAWPEREITALARELR